MRLLADVYAALEQRDEADRLYVECLAGMKVALPAGHSDIGIVLRQHGRLLLSKQKTVESETMLLDAYKVLNAALGNGHPETRSAIYGLVDLYDRTTDRESAALWRNKLSSETTRMDHED
jgi:hypothetical protein